MKRPIQHRQDIEFLVDEFYKKVVADKVIGHIFNDVVQLSWDTHMPIMYSFWESILLGNMTYRGNVMMAHIALNKQTPLTKVHFEQWKKLFFETLDTHFEGEKVIEAKARAETMSQLMLFKIEQSQQKGFIQ